MSDLNLESDQTVSASTQRGGRKSVIIATLFVLLLALGGGGYYFLQSQEAQKKLSAAQADAVGKQKELVDLQRHINSLTQGASATSTSAAYYSVPELGIKFKLDANLQGIEYAYDQKLKVAAFYTRNLAYLAAVDNHTDTYALSGPAVIGLVQVESAVPVCSASCAREVKQLSNGKHVLYNHPQSGISSNPATQKTFDAAITSFEVALKDAQSQ